MVGLVVVSEITRLEPLGPETNWVGGANNTNAKESAIGMWVWVRGVSFVLRGKRAFRTNYGNKLTDTGSW
jgi:hypothetical protein